MIRTCVPDGKRGFNAMPTFAALSHDDAPLLGPFVMIALAAVL